MKKIEKIQTKDRIADILRNEILIGEIENGEELTQEGLAESLGVSRMPVREALQVLEQEGLAVTIPRKGAQVAKMTEKDLQDVLEIRDALDELAVSMACRSTDSVHVKRTKRGSGRIEAICRKKQAVS